MKISLMMFDSVVLTILLLLVALMMPVPSQGGGDSLNSLLPTNFTTTSNTTTTTATPEECAARGPGWFVSSRVQCNNEQIGKKVECNGCARCICNNNQNNNNNTPTQGDNCTLGDFCHTFGTCNNDEEKEEITLYACNCASDQTLMCNTAICPAPPPPPPMSTNTTTNTTTVTEMTTPEECAARGPGWLPNNMVQCDDEQIGTKIDDGNGCARCMCNQPNTPNQGQSCKLGDYCHLYGVCCGTVAEITMYACNCASDLSLICNAAMCAPC